MLNAAKAAALMALAAWLAIGAATAQAADGRIQANVCPAVLSAPTLSADVENSTAAQAATLCGVADPGTTITLTRNGSEVGSVEVATDNAYGLTVGLEVGANQFVATAHDGCGHDASSQPLAITRQQVPPPTPEVSGSLASPTDQASVIVAGQAEPVSTVHVFRNGSEAATVAADANGAFLVSLPLEFGDNEFWVVAANAAGRSAESERLRLYRQMPPALPVADAASSARPEVALFGPARITAPANGTTTTGSSIALMLMGTSGARVSVYRNGLLQATVSLDDAGQATFSVPLVLGFNAWTAQLESAVQNKAASEPVIIERLPLDTVPVITMPEQDITVRQPYVDMAGLAAPGQSVRLVSGGQPRATLIAGSDGRFGGRLALEPGTTYIYAESGDGKVVLRSKVRAVTYAAPAVAAGVAGWPRAMEPVVALTAGLVVIAAQSMVGVVQATAQSVVATGTVLGAAVVATSVSEGLAGAGTASQLPSLVRSALAVIGRRSTAKLGGFVIDSVTGRPLPLTYLSALATTTSHKPAARHGAYTDRHGRFQWRHPAGQAVPPLWAERPGYVGAAVSRPTKAAGAAHIALEPAFAAKTPIRRATDLAVTTAAWLGLGLATAAGWIGLAAHSSLAAWIITLVSTGLLLINVGLTATRPHLKWGRVVGAGGQPLGQAQVSLYRSGEPAACSHYESRADGHYTIYAPRGRYQLEITAPGYAPYRQPLSIRYHAAYIGFPVSLSHASHV